MVRVSEALMKSITDIPGFASALHEAAWKYLEYDDVRNELKEYFDTHDSHRPTKERERLQVCCNSSGSYVGGYCEALENIARNLDERVKLGEVEHVVANMAEKCPDKMEHYQKAYPHGVERPELVDEFVIDEASLEDAER